MRSGATMKVSLTPDRLKSMEVRHHCCRTPVHAERQHAVPTGVQAGALRAGAAFPEGGPA